MHRIYIYICTICIYIYIYTLCIIIRLCIYHTHNCRYKCTQFVKHIHFFSLLYPLCPSTSTLHLSQSAWYLSAGGVINHDRRVSQGSWRKNPDLKQKRRLSRWRRSREALVGLGEGSESMNFAMNFRSFILGYTKCVCVCVFWFGIPTWSSVNSEQTHIIEIGWRFDAKNTPPGSRSHPTRCFFRQARLGYQKKDLEEAKAADGTDGPMAISPCSDPWDPWGFMGAMGA